MTQKKRTIISIMTALCVLLSFIKIPIIVIAPFLTLDLSLLPVMLLARHEKRLAYHTLWLSSFLMALFNGFEPSFLIGEVAQLGFGLLMVYGLSRLWSWFYLGLSEILWMIVLNMVIVLPGYEFIMHFQLDYSVTTYIIAVLLPFNIIKLIVLYFLSRMLSNIR